jgi:hypothetical protein
MTTETLAPPSPWDDETCRCGHPESEHSAEDDADAPCTSPTTRWGDGIEVPYACGCERFRYPDSDD